MKKYQAWRKAWNLGRIEAVVFLVCMGLAVCCVMEFIVTLILKTI
jgi:hypothetical protein